MAKLIPSLIQDETGRNARQNAAAAAALRRLYMSLQAQREQQERNEAMRLQMLEMQQQHAIGMQDRSHQQQWDLAKYRYGDGAGTTGPNLLGPGAAGTPNPMAPNAAPAAAPTASAPAARPSVYTIDKNPFSPGAGTSAPATPAPQASNTTGATVEAFSSQSRKPLPTAEQPPRSPRSEPRSNTQLPTQTRQTPRTAQTRPQAMYLPIDQRWLDLMHQKEDEFNLPRGALMTTYGMENGGGRSFGRNGRAMGIFQFHDTLRDVYKLSEADTQNPEKMIHFAAYNMRRNADILEQNYKVKLPNTPQSIPLWVGLHQWGEKAGPRIVAAYLQNPDAPMVDPKVMGTHHDAKGNVIPNYNVLARNGVDPNATVKQALQNKSSRWLNAYVQQFPDHADQAPGKYVPTPAPQQAEQPQSQSGGSNVSLSGRGANPRLIRAISGGASLALPNGYSLRQTSGHRPGDSGYHGRREAADFQIFTPDGRPIPNRGEDTTGLYTRLARGVKTWIVENDPGFQVNYGGAHGTQKSGGGVPDLMHYDTGPDPGRMRPGARMSQLPLLTDEERNAPVQVAQRQPQATSASAQSRQAPPPAAPERAVLPAISRIPTSGEVAATFDNKIATAGFDRRTPDAAATLGPPPVKAGAGTQQARSDLDYGLDEEGRFQRGIRDTPWYKEYVKKYGEEPNLDDPNYNYRQAWKSGARGDVRDPTDKMLHWPSEFKGPDHPNRFVGGIDTITGLPSQGRITPPDRATLQARSDPNYVAAPPPTIAWGDEALPARGIAGATPPDMEVTPSARSAAPVELTSGEFTVAQPPAAPMPPQLAAGVVPKDQLPAEFTSATQQQATPDPMVGGTATAREPLPPEFKMPLPTTLPGASGAATASAPSGQMPQDMQLPERLPPPQQEQVPQSANAPTIQRILGAIYGGNIPSLSTLPGVGNDTRKQLSPIQLRSVQEAIYGDARPKGPTRAQQELEYARTATPRLTIDAIKERLDPTKGKSESDQVIKNAIEQWMSDKASYVSDWFAKVDAAERMRYEQMNNPPAAKPTKQHPTAQHPQQSVSPPRTMPDGRPYIPQGEPLVVPPPKGGPANTTLSQPPPTGAGAVPLPNAGGANPMTGRPDLIRVPQADGSIQYRTPEEIQQLQEQQ